MRIVTGLVAAVAVALGSHVAGAATDGTPGATSTGSLNITLTIPHLVRITGLTDLTLTHSATGNIVGDKSFCVNDNLSAAGRGYFITATSANADGATFRLASSTPAYLAYSVDYDDDNDASVGGTALASGVQNAAEFDSAAATSMGASCGTPNASIRVTVLEANHQVAEAGAYSDVLTILVTAD